MKYLIRISYDGSKFYGFQRLNKEESVQKVLETALTKINKTTVVVKGAGRTDRGVHALDQCVSFDLNVYVPCDRLINAINSLVEPYIRVNDCVLVDKEFHARFEVKRKTYTYVINVGEFDPIKHDYVYNYNRELDLKSMKKAAKYLIGKHSFEAFVSGKRDNYNSEIFDIKFVREGDYIYITFIGKSFYRYMVRNLVGALMLVGENKIEPDQMNDMLESKTNKYNYITAPASGLYLEKIEY